MDHFNYHHGILCAESIALSQIAQEFGTPCFVYSRATLERHWHAFSNAMGDHDHLICYSVKANSNLAILKLLANLGSGFDVVSLGECQRVIKAGGDPGKIVFSGVGKAPQEIRAALQLGIHCFNIESVSELTCLQAIAQELDLQANIALRINPDVDPQTHPYIATGLNESKFGIDINEAIRTYQMAGAMPNINIIGLDCHIGSQITALSPFLDALDRLLILLEELEKVGITLTHLNLGGGLGVNYRDEKPPEPYEYAKAIHDKCHGRKIKIILEPGRAIAANAGILLTRVLHTKLNRDNHFTIVDCAMNDLIRPALYQSWHTIVPVEQQPETTQKTHVVGPICETGDFLGKSRQLATKQNDLLAIRSTGAYGFVMSSNYNTRPRAPEILVDGHEMFCVRRRESIADCFALESIPEKFS